MICEYILQDGRRLGTRRVASLDAAFVDQLFEKLLFKEVKGEKIDPYDGQSREEDRT